MRLNVHFKNGQKTVVEHIVGSMSDLMDVLECSVYVHYFTVEARNPITPNRWTKWRPE